MMVMKYLMSLTFFYFVLLMTAAGALGFADLTVKCTPMAYNSSIHNDFWSVKCNLNRTLRQNEIIVWSDATCGVLGQSPSHENCNIGQSQDVRPIRSSTVWDNSLMVIYINVSSTRVIFSVFELSKSCPIVSIFVNLYSVTNIGLNCTCKCTWASNSLTTENVSTIKMSTFMTDTTTNRDYSSIRNENTLLTSLKYFSWSTESITNFEKFAIINTLESTNKYTSSVGASQKFNMYKSPLGVIITLPAGICVGFATVLSYFVFKRFVFERCRGQMKKPKYSRDSLIEPLIDDGEDSGITSLLTESIPMTQINVSQTHSSKYRDQTPSFANNIGNVESRDTCKQMPPLPPVPVSSTLPGGNRHLFKVIDEIESGRSLVVAISGSDDNDRREANKTNSIHVYETVNDDDNDNRRESNMLASVGIGEQSLQVGSCVNTSLQSQCAADIHACQTLRIGYHIDTKLNEQHDKDTKKENEMNDTPNRGSSDSTLVLFENVVYSRCSTHTYQSIDDRENYSEDCLSIAEELTTDTVNSNSHQTSVEKNPQQSLYKDDIHSCQTLSNGWQPDAGSDKHSEREDTNEKNITNDSQSEGILDSTLTLNLCENINDSRCSTHAYLSVDGENLSNDCLSSTEGSTTDTVNSDNQQTPVEDNRHYYVLENETQDTV